MGEDRPDKNPEMKKRRRPAWLENLAVVGIVIFAFAARNLPLGFTRFLARMAGRLVFFVCGPRLGHVGRNLDIAFGPDLDPARRKQIARGFWMHVCQGVVEAFQLPRWDAESCAKFVDLTELKVLDKLRGNKKGVILISGHLGSWEVGPYTLALLGYPIHLLHNPGTVAPVFAYLKKNRELSGMKVLARQEHPWTLKKLVDKGNWLLIAADLNAGRYGSFVPFFGVQASTYMSPAALMLAAQCPLVIASSFRREDGRHHFRVWKVIEYQRPTDREAAQFEIMKQINDTLEEAVRAHPEQWLWTYRRWRTRPKDEQAGPDGLPPRLSHQESKDHDKDLLP